MWNEHETLHFVYIDWIGAPLFEYPSNHLINGKYQMKRDSKPNNIKFIGLNVPYFTVAVSILSQNAHWIGWLLYEINRTWCRDILYSLYSLFQRTKNVHNAMQHFMTTYHIRNSSIIRTFLWIYDIRNVFRWNVVERKPTQWF